MEDNEEATDATAGGVTAYARIRLMLFGAILAFSSIFQMGYSNAYPNTAIESFRIYLNQSLEGDLDESGFTWIWSIILNIWFIGFAVGSLCAVPLADRIGRKSCLLIGNLLNFLSAVMATAGVVWYLWWVYLASRLFLAISAGVSMNSLILLLQESSPSSMRGRMSFYAEMAFVLFNTAGAIAGMRIVLGSRVDLLVGLSMIPTLLSVLVVLPFHESPKYLLLKKDDRESASRSLTFYQCTGDAHNNDQLELFEKESEDDAPVEISDLYKIPHIRRGLLLGMTSLQITASIWPIVFLSTELLKRANIDYEVGEVVSTAMLVISCFFTCLGMLLVERLPRRHLFLSSSAVNVCALVLFVVGACVQPVYDDAKYVCILAIVLHGTSYSLAVGPIAWFITAELLPLSHRALAQSVALAVNQLLALCLSFVTLPLYNCIESLGLSGSLTLVPLFVIPGAVCVLFLFWNLPETKGKEIAEVIGELKKSTESSKEESVELKYGSPLKEPISTMD